MKINTSLPTPTTKDGEAVDVTARSESSGSSMFNIVAPGYSLAVVDSLGNETPYRAKYKDIKSKAKDGKWAYLKFRPSVKLLNENGTVINRQDVVVGVLDEDGQLVRPEDDGGNVIWPTAQYLLSALGLFVQNEDGSIALDFDTEKIGSRVVKVYHDVGGYQKVGEDGRGKSYDPKQLKALLTETNGGDPGFTFDDYAVLVEAYNADNGYEGDQALKTKNVITNFYDPTSKEIAEHDFFTVAGQKAVFVSEKDFDLYIAKRDEVEEANDY